MDFKELEQLFELMKKHGVIGFKNEKLEVRIDLNAAPVEETTTSEVESVSPQESANKDYSQVSKDDEQWLYMNTQKG